MLYYLPLIYLFITQHINNIIKTKACYYYFLFPFFLKTVYIRGERRGEGGGGGRLLLLAPLVSMFNILSFPGTRGIVRREKISSRPDSFYLISL